MGILLGWSVMNIEHIATHTLPTVLFRFIVSIIAPLGMKHQSIFLSQVGDRKINFHYLLIGHNNVVLFFFNHPVENYVFLTFH